MIEIKNLMKKYDQHILFDRFNYTIPDQAFTVIFGESGCGKTTLLNMIGALEPVDSGSIIVDQTDITIKHNQKMYLRKKIGFLFQNFALVDHKTVRQNIELIHKNCRSGMSVEEVLSAVDLKDKIDAMVHSLSGGEQQRIALARLMFKQCDIILADEPTGSLDRKNADHIVGILKELNQSHKIIVMVTHDTAYRNAGTDVLDLNDLPR